MPLREFRDYVRTHKIAERCVQSMKAERRKDQNKRCQRLSRGRKQTTDE